MEENTHIHFERFDFPLGDEALHLDISTRGHPRIVYFSLHENEQTSVLAAREVLERGWGILAEIKSRGERLLTFTKNGKQYAVDPNRIFSEAGIKASLEEYSAYDAAVAQEIFVFANAILACILQYEPLWIVALHNTSGDYSVKGYAPGEVYANDAADVFINPQLPPGNFFFTSDTEAFAFIKQAGYNVVLQNNAAVTEDGSLSVYCAQHGIRYINVEALHGNRKEQVEMLQFIAAWF